MTTQDLMFYTYPVLATMLFVYTCDVVIYYLQVRSIRLLLASAVFFALEFLSITLLALGNGKGTLFDFNALRPFVAWSRVLMIPCVFWMSYEVRKILRDTSVKKDKNEGECKDEENS